MKSAAKKIWNYIERISGLIFILYSIFVFSAFAFVKVKGIGPFLVCVIIIVILSTLCCPLILRAVRRIKIPLQIPSNQDTSDLKWKIIFFLVPFLFFLIKYFAFYPTAFSDDSVSQYTQAISNQYSDWHPVIQTLFSIKLPLLLTGGWIGSITLFQIIVFSIVIAYSLLTIKKYTSTKYSIFAMLFVMINPQTTNIAMYPWKDVSFAIGALLLLTYALHIYFTKGEWLKNPLNISIFVLALALTTLFRHNAMLFTIPLMIAVAFYISKKRTLTICLCVLALIATVKLPLYSALGVSSPDKRQVETLGLPMTIIGAAVKYAPEQLDEEVLDFAYKVAPREVWDEKYRYGNYNAVKWDERTDNLVIEEYGSAKVLSMTFNCIKEAPYHSLVGLIKSTEVVYSVCDDYEYYNYPAVASNPYGITTQGISALQRINAKATDLMYSGFSWLFMYTGTMHMVLIVSVLSKCKLNRLKDWKKILFVIPVFAYNFGTALLLTGAADSSRFFYYTFLLMPILLVFLFGKNNERGKDEKVRTEI